MILDIVAGPEHRVGAAFVRWADTVNLDDDFDYGSYRLLPLVFARVRALGVDGALMARLRGIYRKSWYEAQTQIHAMAPWLEILHRHGMRTMLIKGAALQPTYYQNHAVRPMRDLDIVVEPGAAATAIGLFEDAGWTRYETASLNDLSYRHSMMLRGPDGREVDLHWHLMLEACSPAATASFWSRGQPLTYGGVPTLQLGHADMLLHTVIHGMRANREPPLRWIPDAVTVLRVAGAGLDWDRVLEHASTLRLNARLALGLDYLSRHFEAPIPAKVLAELRWRRPTWVERVENSVVLKDTDRLYENVLTKPWVMFAEYARITPTSNPIRFMSGFSHYLRYRSGARGRVELIGDTLRGMTRRIRRALSAQ
jgi:hypothetical protein